VVRIAFDEADVERRGEGGSDRAFTASADAHDDPTAVVTAAAVAGLDRYIGWWCHAVFLPFSSVRPLALSFLPSLQQGGTFVKDFFMLRSETCAGGAMQIA
jgi:hypothetical protein